MANSYRIGRRATFRAALLLLSCLAIASPSRADTRHEQMWSGYDPSEINSVHGGRKLPTLVLGNPFAEPQAKVVTAVADAMTGSQPANQAAAAKAPLRVLMLFNATTRTGERICDRSLPPPVADVGDARNSVDLVATYCRGDRPMTQVVAHADGMRSASDPRFRDFIRQVTASLFPFRNPDMNGDVWPD